MKNLVKRNLNLYFRDKASVFFSLLSVIIVFALYVLFLSNVQVDAVKQQIGNAATDANISYLINTWILAGMLSITTVTSTLGALGFMVNDKEKKILMDFKSSPIKMSTYPIAAIITAIIVGVIISTIAFLIYTIYIFIDTGYLFSLLVIAKSLTLILISSMMSASFMGLLVSFLSTNNAFSSASILIGTSIGFVNGLYIPLGQLSNSLQNVIKLLPFSHIASLFRQTLMEDSLTKVFNNAPQEIITGYTEAFGVTLKWNETIINSKISISFILAVFLLSLLGFFINFKRKREVI